jgi:transcriptional regulator with GAF, ATPase, and Fis domain
MRPKGSLALKGRETRRGSDAFSGLETNSTLFRWFRSRSASLEELQRQHILNALAQTNWVIEGDNGAARLLELHPNTLRSRLKKMGIQRPKA